MSVTGPIRRQMGPLKHQAKTTNDKATAILNQPIPNAESDEMQDYIEALQVSNASLQAKLEKLHEKHDEWSVMVQELDATEQKHYEDSVEEIMDLISSCSDTRNALAARLRRVERSQQASGVPSSFGSGDPDDSHLSNHPKAFKAAKIHLPKFSGDYMEFNQFWGIFKESIHDRKDLSNIEKFTYLLTQLEGDAKKAIAGVLITDKNYDVAVDLLKTRFDRADERLVTMLYSSFMRIANSSGRISDKQKTLDECERIFRQLESAGENVNSNKSLVCGLLSKFPAGMVKDLQRYYSVGANSNLKDVRKGLQKFIAEDEATASMIGDLQGMKLPGNPNRDGYGSGGSSNHPNQPPGQGPITFTATDRKKKQGAQGQSNGAGRTQPQFLSPPCSCYFCGGMHFNGDCTAYPNAHLRFQRLVQLNRCTRCLKAHAKGTQCPFPIKCVHCRSDEQHSSALCPRRYPEAGRYGPGPVGPPTDSGRTATPPYQQPWNNPPSQSPGAPSRDSGFSQGGTAASGGMTMLNTGEVKPALFQTAKTTAVNPITGQQCTVRLAMDTLSSRSYIREPIARKLGLTGNQSERLFVSVFGTSKTLEVPTTRVEVEVTLRDGRRVPLEANTTRIICQAGAIFNNWSNDERKTLSHFHPSLADDPFDNDTTIDVLVGAGNVWEFIDGPRMATNSPGLFLIPSQFGLMLSGEARPTSDSGWREPTMLCITESPCHYPSELGLVSCETKFQNDYPDIDEFWDLERIGISDDPLESDDDRALELFQNTVQRKEDRYEVGLPWIDEKKALLPSNYDLAYDRFRKLVKRLHGNNDLLESYRDIFALQLERGIIEEVPLTEIQTNNLTHYLPHHPVFKPSSSTTKVRIVYDAAAKEKRGSPSLNECLFRGPVLLPDLCQLIMRLRIHRTVVMSDIEKAFLQVGLRPTDRDVLRFLWLKDDTRLCLKDNVKAYRFTRVNFGVICSPFLLAATLDHHLTLENSDFAESLRNGIYVDNVFSGFDERDPSDYYTSLKQLFERAGMNIQEFCSNSQTFMAGVPESDRVKNPDATVLGLKWDSLNDDTLRLIPSKKLEQCGNAKSKREVLTAIASVFDPMGFFQPILLPAKCFLQKLWSLKYDWDSQLSPDLASEWETLGRCIFSLFQHRIPRFVGRIGPDSSLAVFSDASARAYAAAIYLRCKNDDGSWQCRLIFAKSRLAPSAKSSKRAGKEITLPRLELLGAVIGARAGCFCRSGFRTPDMKIDFFVDSQCVLRWIAHKGLLKRFVSNRVDEIRKVTNCEFHYVNTKDNPTDLRQPLPGLKDNPADFSTRGKLPEELFVNSQWWNGPDWLTQDRTTWPKSEFESVSDVTLREIQSEYKPVYLGQTMAATTVSRDYFLTIDSGEISSLFKLVRISTVCLRFLKLRLWNKLSTETKSLKQNLKIIFDKVSDDGPQNSEEYQMVLHLWVKATQQSHYTDVFSYLQTGQSVPQIVHQLGLHMDAHGLLRCQGRLENADLPLAARNPILLPKDDNLSSLIVADVHNNQMHSGVSHTLSQLRLQFWIPQGRALVRKVLRNCLVCRRFKSARPFKLPPMPSWPKERVSQSAPFESTGLDYFGPINVKVNDGKHKMWVCLFTCLATRAIHLEAVMDFSAQEFLHCVIRFCSRRGVPKMIISDNAAQFQLVKILGDKAWKKCPRDESVIGYAASNGLKWKFITELAPWQGGFYERLVGLVKSTLRTSIRRKLLSWTDFITLLAEAEAVVNSRPITYVGDDLNSRVRVIRPCDFLTPLSTSLTDECLDSQISPKDFGEAGRRLVSIWKQRCRTLESLWKCWHDDYLLSLRERHVVSHKGNRSDNRNRPVLDQIVLVCDSDLPRGQWKLAKITKLFPGNDGQVRSAEVTLSTGIKLRRALNHLVPLEVEPVHHDDDEQDRDDPADGEADTSSQADTHQQRDDPATASVSSSDQIEVRSQVDHSDPWMAQFDDNDEDFLGFTALDIQRTVDALERGECTDRV